MLVTPDSIRAAYDFLRVTAFSGVRMPSASRFRFMAKRMRSYHGWYDDRPRVKRPDFVIDTGTKTLDKFFKIVAHEMCHVALDQNGKCDHDRHDGNFKELAKIVEGEMCWSRGSV